jgi:serine protease
MQRRGLVRSLSVAFLGALAIGGGIVAYRTLGGSSLPPVVDNPANSPILVGHEAAVSEADEEVAGEIAVDLKDDLSPEDLQDLETTFGLSPNSAWSKTHDHVELAHVAITDEGSILERLRSDSRVENAEPMEILRASFVPNDPFYNKQWHLTRVGAETAWEYACGEGVTVAVIDTGVACFDKGPFSRGSDLGGTRCEGGYNFVHDSPEAFDDQGHGTHVAGTVAQTTNNGKGVAGLAFCARLMPVKVLNRFGWGTSADVAEGIRFAADNGAQVINLSLGSPSKSAIIEDAVDHALKKGVVVVAAAGNSGRSVGYPAAYDGVIAVSATDADDKIAWFSSRGPEVAIAAPGVGVTQQTICEGGRNKCEIFSAFSGTSMASPHVAGAAALVVGLGVSGPEAVRAALGAAATAKDDPKLYGAGVLNAGAAVARVFWVHVAARLAALVALGWFVASRIRRKSGSVAHGPGMLFGALLGSVGLLPILPLLKLAPRFDALRWLAELLMRPFGEWDLIVDAGWHRFLPLANALPAIGLAVLFFGAKRLRSTIGGFALGSAALMTQLAIFADVATPFGSFTTRIWLAVNCLVCLWLARVTLDKKRA